MPKDNPEFDEAMFADLEAEGLALLAELASMPMPELLDIEHQDIDFSTTPPEAPKRTCKAPIRPRKVSGSVKTSIRIPAPVWNAYGDEAERTGVKRQTLINKVLKLYMPK